MKTTEKAVIPIHLMNTENTTIFIADCHIRAHSDEEGDFFEMLDHIEANPPKRLVFLGDIFELWIALDGYESFGHHQFVEWCARNKAKFEIGFIEGNHEYFITQKYIEYFSWISAAEHLLDNGIKVIHGDKINRRDIQSWIMRSLIRNPLTRLLLRLTAHSIGPEVCDRVRIRLKTTNMKFRHSLPEEQLIRYAQKAAEENILQIFSGHFHYRLTLQADHGAKIDLLPAWVQSGEIAILSPDGDLVCRPWKELLF